MVKINKILLAIALAFLLLGNFAFLNSNAQAKGLALSPAKIPMDVLPGKKYKANSQISNTGDFSIRMKLSVKNYKAANENGDIEFTSEQTGFEMKDWIIPEFLEINLKPFETKTINFIIQVPENAKLGGHYGAIIFEGKNYEIKSSDFGILILANVKKEEEIKKGNFVSFDIPFISEHSPIDFAIKIENTGNVHFMPEGKIQIFNIFGKKITEAELKNDYIYPSSTRKFSSRWNKKNLSGIFKAKASVKYNGEQTEAIKFFIVFPWRLVLFGAIAIIALIVIWKYYKKNIFIYILKFLKKQAK
jgi:hypothetical protein